MTRPPAAQPGPGVTPPSRTVRVFAITGIALSAALVVAGLNLRGIHALPAVWALAVCGAVAAATAIFVWARKREQHRRRVVAQSLQPLDLPLIPEPDKALKEAVFAGVAHIGAIKFGKARAIQWVAEHAGPDGPERIFEHRYVVSTGKSAHTVLHTVATAPCPAAWPDVSIRARNLLHALLAMLGRRPLRLDDPAFNARWTVACAEPEFAVLLLTPDVQRWLLSAPRAESWYIGRGQVVCLWHGRTDPALLPSLFERPRQFLALVPRELWEWLPPGAASARAPAS